MYLDETIFFADLLEFVIEKNSNFYDVVAEIKNTSGFFRYEVKENPLFWRNNYTGKMGSTFQSLYCDWKACFPDEGARELACKFGFTQDNLLASNIFSSKKAQSLELGLAVQHDQYYKDKQIPDGHCIRGRKYEVYHEFLVKGSNQLLNGSLILYKIDEDGQAILPLSIHKKTDIPSDIPFWKLKWNDTYYLSLGASQGHLRFVNEDLIADNYDATIVLCEDPFVAAALAKKINLSASTSLDNAVITTWFGGRAALKYINPSALQGRAVIFIPKVNGAGLEVKEIERFYRHWGERRTVRFSVYPDIADYRDIEQQDDIVECILTEAVGFSDLLRESKVKLTQFGQTTLQEIASCMFEPLPDNLDMIPESGESETISLDNIIKPYQSTLLFGPTDVGKGFVALTLALAYSAGVGVFGFKPGVAHNVFYIAAEEEKSEFMIKCNRIKSALGISGVKISFNYCCVREWKEYPDFNLGEKDHREVLEAAVQRFVDIGEAPDLLVFDNIISLYGSETAGFVDKVKRWTDNLESRFQTAILFCHHSNEKTNKMAGRDDIKYGMKNIIRLDPARMEGKLQVPEEDRPVYRPYLEKDGILMRMVFEKIKNAPSRKGKVFGYFLSSAKLGAWESVSPTRVIDIAQKVQSMFNYALGPRELEIVEILSCGSRMGRLALDKRLQLSAGATRNALVPLLDKGIVVASGRGKATKYALSPSLRDDL